MFQDEFADMTIVRPSTVNLLRYFKVRHSFSFRNGIAYCGTIKPRPLLRRDLTFHCCI